jgi:hypothetical protein
MPKTPAPRRRSDATPATTRIAWWISDGDEECPHCGRLYVYELEFRCAECDGPGCAHCKHIHTEGHQICPGCVSGSAAAAQDT